MTVQSAIAADLSCLRVVSLVACRRHYPGETHDSRLFAETWTLAFPLRADGRLSRIAFSRLARRSLTLRPADSLNWQHQPFDIRGSRLFVTSQSTPTASRHTTTSGHGSRTHRNNTHQNTRRTHDAQASGVVTPDHSLARRAYLGPRIIQAGTAEFRLGKPCRRFGFFRRCGATSADILGGQSRPGVRHRKIQYWRDEALKHRKR